MTSTGTTALYLHPSDALHGGLGVVNQGDVALVLSNSGETDELIAMMPYLRQRSVAVIAIVGNLKSTLARHADAVLDAAVDKEACPLNLAPTTSTTVALAIGDALAMTLMRVKELTPEMFAINHPAGRLGKRLYAARSRSDAPGRRKSDNQVRGRLAGGDSKRLPMAGSGCKRC
ncbi:MAG: SIS domain-containing protein [Pyrinomonadaceae bacterium]